jgi:hypothetical protein
VTFAGPVLSYFEWKRLKSEAVTPQGWLKMLNTTPGPSRPEWAR